MILGRNTAQWTSLLTAVTALILLFIQQFAPEQLPTATTLLAGIGAFLGFFLAWLTYTETTPMRDARLQVGAVISATDPDTGVIIGHVKVPQPAPAPEAPDVGPKPE